MPKETGEHLVHVKKSGQHVASSPIPVMISQSEIGDASRVRVSGQGLHEGHTFEPAEFIIDTRDAGKRWRPARQGEPTVLGSLAQGCPLGRLRRAQPVHRGPQQSGHQHRGPGGWHVQGHLLPHGAWELHHQH